MRTTLMIVVVLAVLTGAVVIANVFRDPKAYGVDWKLQFPKGAKQVTLQKPSRSTVIQTITAPGTIELVEQADIAPQIMGQVTQVAVQKGQRVKKGDLLLELDDSDARARLKSIEARIERLRSAIKVAEADLTKATRDSSGFTRLAARGFSTPTEVADAETMVAKMKASLAMSRHDLAESLATKQTSLKELERTRIVAPISGDVIDHDVEVGEVVIAGTTNLPGSTLMTIGDVNRKRVRANVDESDVALVKASQRALIFLQSDLKNSLTGHVELVAPSGEKEGEIVTFETLVGIDGNQPTLRPGMTATLEIEVKRSENALCLPVQAVVHRRLKALPDAARFRDWAKRQKPGPGETEDDVRARYVPVVFLQRDGKAFAQPVETGISDQERVEILQGVQPDDDVITGPFRTLDELKDGDPVELLKPSRAADDSEADGNADDGKADDGSQQGSGS